MLITPAVMDFVEQTLESLEMEHLIARSKRDVSETSGVASMKKEKTDEQPPAAFLASTVLPFDLVIYVYIESSALRFTCGPVSRIECLLRTPRLKLLASTCSLAYALGALALGEKEIQLQVASRSFVSLPVQLTPHQPLLTRPPIEHSTFVTSSEPLARAAFASSSLSGTGELAPVLNTLNVTAVLSDFSLRVPHLYSRLKDRCTINCLPFIFDTLL